MATRMQQRSGTASQWSSINPVLADGEIGYEKDTGIIKVGNGATTWGLLPAAFGSTYLPLLGKAADSDKLDGLDSTAFLLSSNSSSSATNNSIALRTAAGRLVAADGVSATDVATFGQLGARELLTAANTHRLRTTALETRPRVVAYRASATGQSIPDVTFTAVQFDAEHTDLSGMHSTSSLTSRFTVPTGQSGAYLIGGAVAFSVNPNGPRVAVVYKNGLEIPGSGGQATPNSVNYAITTLPMWIVDMVAGDYLEIFCYHGAGGTLPLAPGGLGQGTSFSMLRVA